MRIGYFLITLFYLPGFRREPCSYLSLPPGSGFWNSVSPAWHTPWQFSLHPSCGPLLSHPYTARWQPTSFSASGQAQVSPLPFCRVGQISLLAKQFQALPSRAEWAASSIFPPRLCLVLCHSWGWSAVGRCTSCPSLGPSITPCVTCAVLWEAESPSPTKPPRWHPKSSLQFTLHTRPLCNDHASDHSAVLLTSTCFSAQKPIHDQKLTMLGLQVLPSAITLVFQELLTQDHLTPALLGKDHERRGVADRGQRVVGEVKTWLGLGRRKAPLGEYGVCSA